MRLHWFIKFLIGCVILLLLFFCSLMLPKLLPVQPVSNSSVYGLVFNDQVWEGTVRVLGDTYFLPTATVEIKPGTTVLVSTIGDKSNLDMFPWHKNSGVNTGEKEYGVEKGEPFWDENQKIQIHFGKVNAVGTKELPIIFRSDALNTSPYDFNVLSARSGIFANVHFSNYRRFELLGSATVRDSQFEEIGECAVCIVNSTPSIINNVFGSTLRESIWVFKASPRITDNFFNNLVGDGIRVDPKKIGEPVISFNTFEVPGQVAIHILGGRENGSGVVSFNKFSGNSRIIIVCDSRIRFNQNEIYSLVEFDGAGCGGNYIFGPNIWTSNDINTILSEQITNEGEKFKVLIPSIMDSPPKLIGRRVQN